MNRLAAVLALVLLAAGAPTLVRADPTNDVKNAFMNFGRLTSWHMTVTTAKGMSMNGDFVQPGKMHVTAGPMEMIEIDTTTYVKVGGTWRQFSMPGMDRMTAPLSYANTLGQKVQGEAAHVTITDLGMKDGMHAYAVKDADHKPTTVYVDGSGQVARIEANGPDGVDVMTFSNFDAPISIVAPI